MSVALLIGGCFLFFSIFILVLSGMLVHSIDIQRAGKRILFLFYLFASLWCGGFGYMILTTNWDVAYVSRLIGLIGVYGFIVMGVRFLMFYCKRDYKWAKILWGVDAAVAIACVVLVSPKSAIHFIQVPFGTSYEAEIGWVKYFSVVFLICNVLICFGIMHSWERTCRYRRNKKIVQIFSIAELVLVTFSFVDSLLPFVGNPSFPSSCVGVFVIVVVIYMAGMHMNAFSLTRGKVAKYIYENVETPVIVVDEDSKLLICNVSARKYFDLKDSEDSKEAATLEDLFEISDKDAKSYIARVLKGTKQESCVLNARKSQSICEIAISSVLDEYQEPICFVCFVYDMTKEYEAIHELEAMKNSLELSLDQKTKQIEGVALQAITTIANFIDSKEEYTSGHSTRVAKYSEAIAKELGWSEEEVVNLHYVALLHDIGKIGVPYDLLNKPAKLSDAEREIMKQHTVIGEEILGDITTVKNVDLGALYHHERYDGTGYPRGLVGNDIPMVARIISVADAFDAMTSDRRYRAKLSPDKVRQEFEINAGKQFDPYITSVFLRMMDEGSIQQVMEEVKTPEYDSLLAESNQLLAKIMEGTVLDTTKEAGKDYLTGLWKRKTGEKHLIQYLRNGDGALLIIDLDNFKQINDIYGHMGGDYALTVVTDVLKNNCKDAILCRMAGDEFMMFLKEVNTVAEAKPIVDGIIYTFNSRMEEEEVLAHTALSIGIAFSKSEGRDYQDLFRCADRALYYVKQNGKCGYSFHQRAQLGGNNAKVDLERLVYVLNQKGEYPKIYQKDIQKMNQICEYVWNYIQEDERQVELILFTMDFDQSSIKEMEDMDIVMNDMDSIIRSCITNEDVSTRFSSSQILIGAGKKEKREIEELITRIQERFYQMYSQKDAELLVDHITYGGK